MSNWQHVFAHKKITLMGLGLLGRGVGDAKFLAEQGAELIVTDLKTKHDLAASLEELKGFPNITYHLGKHDLADFTDRDFILKGAGIPLDSPFIAEARRKGIPIKMSASWFAELAEIPIVGVTGTRGKSTVTHMLDDIMRAAEMEVLLGGNVRGISTLALLPKVRRNSIGLLELDSWQCQGFGDAGISPSLAVFTSFLADHMNYYLDMDAYLADKAHIFLHQRPEDTLVISTQAAGVVREHYGRQIRSHVVIADPAKFPGAWALAVPGEHNIANAMCAIEAARALSIDDEVIQKALAAFKGLPGRLEFLREVNGIKIYNDNNSTTPDATIAGLRAVGAPSARSVVLIMGGDEKNLDMSKLIEEIPKWCNTVVLFKERGTDAIRDKMFALQEKGVTVYEEDGLKECLRRACVVARPKETILYSPAFSSFGKYFKNEFDRGEQFTTLVKDL